MHWLTRHRSRWGSDGPCLQLGAGTGAVATYRRTFGLQGEALQRLPELANHFDRFRKARVNLLLHREQT